MDRKAEEERIVELMPIRFIQGIDVARGQVARDLRDLAVGPATVATLPGAVGRPEGTG
jgi:hypothetical protein